MKITITGEAAEALVKNIRAYTEEIDPFSEDGEDLMLEVLNAISLMFDDILMQESDEVRDLTSMEKMFRTNNGYYVPVR